jgi:acetyl-CoA/propionyl-CoA carboxylase carboxyl transferase subunit
MNSPARREEIDVTILDSRQHDAQDTKPQETTPQDTNPQVRLEALFDPGSLSLLSAADDSGVLAGTGTIDGMLAVAFASDPRVQGGATGSAGCAVIVSAYDHAIEAGAPVIGLWHSGGARLREGVESLHAVGTVFAAMTLASGKVPQISVVLGPAAGGAAYGPALTDLVILSDQGRIFVTGPDVVRSVTGEDVDFERLGGPEPHSRRSGVVHLVAETDVEALGQARRLALLLGRQEPDDPGGAATEGTDVSALLPESPRRAYDVHPLVTGLLDEPGIELHPRWAPNIVTTLGRLAGRTVGVIANNPLRLGGCLDATSAEKAARFVRMCDAFGVPLIVIVDTPGYLPGVGQEWGGPAGREAAARVRRGHRAAGHAGDQEGLRRRLHRDELAFARRHAGVRLADRGTGRDGPGRGGPDPAPPHARRGPARAAARGRGPARGRARARDGRAAAGDSARGGRRDRGAGQDPAGAGPGDRRGPGPARRAREHPTLSGRKPGRE